MLFLRQSGQQQSKSNFIWKVTLEHKYSNHKRTIADCGGQFLLSWKPITILLPLLLPCNQALIQMPGLQTTIVFSSQVAAVAAKSKFSMIDFLQLLLANSQLKLMSLPCNHTDHPTTPFFQGQMKDMAKIRLFYSGDMAQILPQ